MTSTGTTAEPRVSARQLRTLWVVLLRTHLSRARVFVAVLVAVLLTVVAVAANIGGEGIGTIRSIVIGGAMTLSVPVLSLVFAVAVLGDHADDGSLVYLWLRPVPPAWLGLAAVTATVSVAVPVNVLTVTAIAVAGGQPGLVPGAALAVTFATLAYGALFTALGLRTNRSLLWGLGYLLIVEGFFATLSSSVANWTVRRPALSIFVDLEGGRDDLATMSALPGSVLLLAIAAVGVGATTWWLRTRDVD